MEKAHGIISIFFILLSQVIAMTVMFLHSTTFGSGYALLFVASSLAIVYSYCTKCPIRLTGCKHVFIGPITRLFPERDQIPYTKRDYAIVIASLGVMMFVPQAWLWDYPKLAAAFWMVWLIAAIEINRFICNRCDNVNCIACRKN